MSVTQIAAAERYTRARLQLGVLAGYPADHPPAPAGELDEPRPPPTREALLEAARVHQPRLRTLHALRVEAGAREALAGREVAPDITLGVQVNRESFALGPPETQVLGIVSMPLSFVQRNRVERAEARAETRIAYAERSAFERHLQSWIEQHRSAVIATAEQVKTYGGEILPTFEENLRLLQRAFELGEIDILQVSVARERFLRIQNDALEAHLSYFEAVADLEAAIGTDLWPEERQGHRVGDPHDAGSAP